MNCKKIERHTVGIFYITLQRLADALIQSDLHNILNSIYLASIYTAGYVLKQFRLSTSLKGTMAVSYPVIDIQAQFLAHCATLPNFSSNVRGSHMLLS
uniref:Uncharacterized protein n=1 Tax=Anguilla anguilla TaxID=7936 RepID=A0A0E9VNK1_ANGAN